MSSRPSHRSCIERFDHLSLIDEKRKRRPTDAPLRRSTRPRREPARLMNMDDAHDRWKLPGRALPAEPPAALPTKNRWPCQPKDPQQKIERMVREDVKFAQHPRTHALTPTLIRAVKGKTFQGRFPPIWAHHLQQRYITCNERDYTQFVPEARAAANEEVELRSIEAKLEQTHFESVKGVQNATEFPLFSGPQSNEDSLYVDYLRPQLDYWVQGESGLQPHYDSTADVPFTGVHIGGEDFLFDNRLFNLDVANLEIPLITMPSIRRSKKGTNDVENPQHPADYHCVHLDHPAGISSTQQWAVLLVVRPSEVQWYVRRYKDAHTFFVVLPARATYATKYCVGDSKYACYMCAKHLGARRFFVMDDQVNGFEHNALDKRLSKDVQHRTRSQLVRFPLTWEAALRALDEMLTVTQAGMIAPSTKEPIGFCDEVVLRHSDGGRQPNGVWLFNTDHIDAKLTGVGPRDMWIDCPIHPAYAAAEDTLMHMVLFQRGVRVIKTNTIRFRKWATGGGTCGRGTGTPYQPIERYLDFYRLCNFRLMNTLPCARKSARERKATNVDGVQQTQEEWSHVVTSDFVQTATVMFRGKVRLVADDESGRECHRILLNDVVRTQHMGRGTRSLVATFNVPRRITLCVARSQTGVRPWYLHAEIKDPHPYGTRWIMTVLCLYLLYEFDGRCSDQAREDAR